MEDAVASMGIIQGEEPTSRDVEKASPISMPVNVQGIGEIMARDVLLDGRDSHPWHPNRPMHCHDPIPTRHSVHER